MKAKTKKTVFIALIAAVLAIAVVSVFLYLRKKENDRTVRIAFFGLPQEIADLIQKEIPENEELNVVFTYLNNSDIDLGIISSKFDMLFTYEGELTDTLGKSSEEFSRQSLSHSEIPRRNRNAILFFLITMKQLFTNLCARNTA